jgi:hypothetical protein
VGLPISPFAGTNGGHGIVALAAKAGDCQVLALVVLDEEPAVFVESDTSASYEIPFPPSLGPWLKGRDGNVTKGAIEPRHAR